MTRWMISLLTSLVLAAAQVPRSSQGIRLEDLTWMEAEKVLTPDTVVVLPIGAAAKEHGPHLKLKNDLILAEYLTRRVLERANVVVAPTLTYHFYPSFLEYPGSTSLTLETARDMTVQIVRTLAAYGPKRFYALNTGVSTVRALGPAAEILARDGILFRYTDLNRVLTPIERQVAQQPGGTHADEIETSMILYMDPSSVDLTKAAKDYDETGKGPLSRTRGKPGTVYSPTGVFGDATLATRAKGQAVVEAFVPALVREIEETRVTPVPAARPARSPSGPPSAAPASPMTPSPAAPAPGTFQDERSVRELTAQFTLAWTNQDPWGIAGLFTEDGEIVHSDGVVERMQQIILEQRSLMFMRSEYRFSRHRLTATDVRFVVPGAALVTGTWELLGVTDANRKLQPATGGPCTVVVRLDGEGWRIVSLRYGVDPRGAPTAFTHLPKAAG